MQPTLVSKANGMIAGLEIWLQKGKFILKDSSIDGRFASDVQVWTVGLNTKTIKKRKDAKKQDTTTTCGPNTNP
jgi:hypothetical protein